MKKKTKTFYLVNNYFNRHVNEFGDRQRFVEVHRPPSEGMFTAGMEV